MARAILERRCATGEITRQQYEKLLQELGWDDAKSNNSGYLSNGNVRPSSHRPPR